MHQTKSFFPPFLITESGFFSLCLSASLTQIHSISQPLFECLACHKTYIINHFCFNINNYIKSFSQLLSNSLFIAFLMIYLSPHQESNGGFEFYISLTDLNTSVQTQQTVWPLSPKSCLGWVLQLYPHKIFSP